jgi:multicomponent Na+:H+ antiporter subunit E
MLHAAAMMIGLWAIWLVLTQTWMTPGDVLAGGAIAFVCMWVCAFFGGLGRGGGLFVHGPRLVLLALGRLGQVLNGAVTTTLAAFAPGSSLRPALVRVKLRSSSDFARAALADMIGAAPGAVVVEADAEGLLVHVLDEEAIDAADLGGFEARVTRAVDGGRQ